ncbi:hypothetical protein BX616_002474 [Lobosporangium transversale]|nr:hypothetical protein BX616_002474 [Lobosporangium transversale]
MAPDCKTGLTLRNFQMAALDDSEIDPLTKRPLKVLVCKDHVPMPKHSFSRDSLSLKHTLSAPKPSMAGIHRSLMGNRGLEQSMNEKRNEESRSGGRQPDSPRSLDQGSHAEIMKNIEAEKKEREEKKKEEEQKEITTLPKFRQGEFTITPESAEPNKEDVYGSKNDGDDGNDDEDDNDAAAANGDEWKDHKQERVFTMKKEPEDQHTETGNSVGATTAATIIAAKELTEPDEEKLGELAFSSKLMKEHKEPHHEQTEKSREIDQDEDKTIEDDEWDTGIPTNNMTCRESEAGI